MSDDPKCDRGVFARLLSGTTAIVHEADHSLTLGTVRPASDGKPMIPGTRLFVGQEDGILSEVETTSTSGPAKVNSREFREGWGRIFGGEPIVGEA